MIIECIKCGFLKLVRLLLYFPEKALREPEGVTRVHPPRRMAQTPGAAARTGVRS